MADSDLFDLNSDMDVDPPHPPPPRFLPKLKGKLLAVAGPAPPPNQDQAMTDVISVEEDDDKKEEEEGGGDCVVREIDVFCTPLEGDDAQLYLMQYPLRPHWHPYELEERCKEVKVKPKSLEVEVVLSVDVESENFNQDMIEATMFHEQTLSSRRAFSEGEYAAGFLLNNQVHMNPVREVLQFWPSKDHLNDPEVQKGKFKSQEVGSKPDKGKSVLKDSNDNIGSEEPWVSLQYNALDSAWSGIYREKLMTQQDYHIDFTMNPSEYLDSLCPRTSTLKWVAKVPSSSFFPLLPLEERLKKWLSKGCQVNRFDALKYLDADASDEDFLNMLQRHAVLIQGLWVSKSSLIYEGYNASLRDYILYLFSTNQVIKQGELDKLKKKLHLKEDYLKNLLRPLAYERLFKDWKLREERDVTFIKGHPQIVREQNFAWLNRAKGIEESLSKVGRPVIAKNSPVSNITKRKLDAPNKTNDGTRSSAVTSLSIEMRDSLHKALSEIFSDGNARSLNSIQRKLQELAITKSSRPKEDSKTKALVSFLSTTASGPSPVLLSVLKEVAFEVHNVYVLKSGQNPAHDLFREVVVMLFCGKDPNAMLKKQEILVAAKARLKRDILVNEYSQVLKELCVHSNGAWVLRSEASPI